LKKFSIKRNKKKARHNAQLFLAFFVWCLSYYLLKEQKSYAIILASINDMAFHLLKCHICNLEIPKNRTILERRTKCTSE